MNYQFLYEKDIGKLSKIYKDYLGDHLGWFDFFAGSSLRNTLAKYTAFEVIQLRDQLSAEMEIDLTETMSNMGISVTALQLLSTSLPSRFMDAIEETILAEQAVEKAEFDRAKAVISGQTKRLQAKIAGENLLVNAEAEATSTLLEAEARATGIEVRLQAEKTAYKALFDQTKAKFPGFSKEQLLAYIWTESIGETDAGNLLVNFQKEVELS